MSNPAQFLPPGFRFHPTDEELILHYMRSRAAAAPCPAAIIADVDIYKSDPWDLPEKAMFGDREWYFFSPRDRKYPNGVRPNRAAGSGYWKATGTDKPIHSTAAAGKNEHIGVKKALVFYKGKPPKGLKTNWIMHEYRLAETQSSSSSSRYKPLKLRDTSMRLDDWVLCRIYKKSNHQPPADREPDDSCREEGSPSIPQNVAIHQDDNDDLKLPKSASLSEFLDSYSALSHLFDELPEFPDLSSLMGNPIASQPINSSSSNNGINYLLAQQLPQSGSYTDNSLKRQREDSLGLLNPSKRWSNSQSFTNQLDNTQFSLMTKQPLFKQPLL